MVKSEYFAALAIVLFFWWKTQAPPMSVPVPQTTDEAALMGQFGTSRKRSVLTYVRQFDRLLALNSDLVYGPNLRPY